MKVSFKQFIKLLLALIVILAIGIPSTLYYFKDFPLKLATEVHDSLLIKEHITTYLSEHSKLIDNLQLNREPSLTFFDKTNKECLKINISGEQVHLFKKNKQVWKGKLSTLSEYILETTILSKCSQVCPRFKPSFLAQSEICIELNQEGNITKVAKPIIWQD